MLHPKLNRKIWCCVGGAALVFLLALSWLVRVEVTRNYKGVYLLREGPYRLVLTDMIQLGQEDRLLFALHWDEVAKSLHFSKAFAPAGSHLQYDWFQADGSGFVRNVFPNGTMLITCFSRFVDAGNAIPRGIFVGGNVPYEEGNASPQEGESGMAFFDGKKWRHLWGNANEGIALGNGSRQLSPSKWEFLGSRVLVSSREKMVLSSSHRVAGEGMALHIDRFAVFKAGEPYFILVNRVRNEGRTPALYYYVYGDEPSVGDYRGSTGNVGWGRGRLFQYETGLDPERDSYFGMYDHGNSAAGETQQYTNLANFIESLGARPDLMYFSNRLGFFASEKERVPLQSPTTRVLSMQWGPRQLAPGEADVYVLAIGMASCKPGNDIPVKPHISFSDQDISDLLARHGKD
ncbi:hypothetical protein Gbem_3469 [Citrifermentans bemidjiense Bem]|uniref:Uncharacterized protein n=1 Tax=Citrifermentans bemidjiense (strain ATCC BAA-1014 / DSM 16622 / JCM 12645 / Bem) TaxID=404380 RepID=B5EC06_CITBB|nr:hypothetical protein [Citrifermentans bemidjiense]ACH40462.1 hypothetical protein Gbem_3469 [Citrifermentans bemidjiense Bem]